jgi:hypothetical protein
MDTITPIPLFAHAMVHPSRTSTAAQFVVHNRQLPLTCSTASFVADSFPPMLPGDPRHHAAPPVAAVKAKPSALRNPDRAGRGRTGVDSVPREMSHMSGQGNVALPVLRQKKPAPAGWRMRANRMAARPISARLSAVGCSYWTYLSTWRISIRRQA